MAALSTRFINWVKWIQARAAALPGASASAIHYLYLARVPFLGLITLLALPLTATGAGRSLFLGAYDLFDESKAIEIGQAFFVGIACGLAGGSIYFTAKLITSLSPERFKLRIDEATQNAISALWFSAILIALFINLVTVIRASPPSTYQSSLIGVAMVTGITVAVIGVWWAAISDKLEPTWGYRWLVSVGIKIGLQKQPGYLYSKKKNPANPEDWDYYDGIITAFCFALIVVLAYWVISAVEIPPLVTIALLISLAVLVLAGVTYFGDFYRLPLLVVLLAYFWSMGFLGHADHYYPVWSRSEIDVELTPSEIVGRATQQRRPLVIVAAAGGGIQSAAWTTSVLDQLGKRLADDSGGQYDLPHSVRLISGVSGGSVGAMFYAQVFSENHPDFGHSFQAACLSALAPTVRGMLRQDLWRALAPLFVSDIYDDRGQILERKWCRNFDERFRTNAKLHEATLSGWGADALSLKRPALVLNSTIVETGERLAISTVPTRNSLLGETEFTKRYCADIAISTAARLSATFPFVTPTGRPAMENRSVHGSSKIAESRPLCGGGNQHVVDGGYYESSGLVGAIEWIDEALTDLCNPNTNPRNYPPPRHILILIIDSFKREDPKDPKQSSGTETKPAEGAHGVLYNLASPLNTVMSVRGSAQRFFAQRLLLMLEKRWALEDINISDVRIFFDVKNEQNRDSGAYVGVSTWKQPLSWHLRPSEIAEVKKEWIGLSDFTDPDNYQAILDFFKNEASQRN